MHNKIQCKAYSNVTQVGIVLVQRAYENACKFVALVRITTENLKDHKTL